MSVIDQYDLDAVTQRLPIEEMRESLAELQAMRSAIDERINAMRRLLDALTGKQGYPRKRDAVLGLLGESGRGEMSLARIRAHLITRGEIEDTPRAAHALQMMLSTLVREGHVERVKQGVYRLDTPGAGDRIREAIAPYQGGHFGSPDGEQAATVTDLHRQEGRSVTGQGDPRS